MALLKVVCVNQAEAIHNCLVLVRLARSAVKYTGALRLNMPARGSLTGLRCVPQADTAKTAVPAPNAVQLRIRAVGLNFRDVLNVTWHFRGLSDFSGRNSRVGRPKRQHRTSIRHTSFLPKFSVNHCTPLWINKILYKIATKIYRVGFFFQPVDIFQNSQ